MRESIMIISVLGDSLSTFEGYTPSRAVFFDRYNSAQTGLESVEDTWWMQVIRSLKGELGVNHSLAGSTVAGGLLSSGTSEERIRALGAKGDPDLILVMMGTNDWAYGVLPDDFEEAYGRMLKMLRRQYPNAEVWCGTIPSGKLVDPAERFFFNMDSLISPARYTGIIQRLAQAEGMKVADLGKNGEEYETIDGVHPNKKGMATLAGLWISSMEK